MTEALPRTSALAQRHRALGSALEDWNGMGTAWEYRTDPDDEHDAIREAAGLFDMSPLKKVRVAGPDATAVVDFTHTRDLSVVAVGQSAYGAVLTDEGTVADDAIAFRLGEHEWLFVHGTGASMELLEASARGKDVRLELDDDLHIVSLQGPAALDLLDAATDAPLASLPYFHHVPASLFGRDAMISRTGYSGERGYEVFVGAADAGTIWDSILLAGSDAGVVPCSFAALDKVRVEAALLFYGYDMTDTHHPSEVGLGWALSHRGASYRGKANALAVMGEERHVAAGIVIDHSDALQGGEVLRHGARDVGTVNSPVYSRRLGLSLALVHLTPEAAVPGTDVAVVGSGGHYAATVVETPFFDPAKRRTHA